MFWSNLPIKNNRKACIQFLYFTTRYLLFTRTDHKMLKMPKHVKKLLVFDIDGTLAQPADEVTDVTKRELKQIHEDEDITMAVSSGQSEEYCKGFMRAVGVSKNLIIISENGSAIYDVDTKLHYVMPEAKLGQIGISSVREFINKEFAGLMISETNMDGILYPVEKKFSLTIGCINPKTDMKSVEIMQKSISEFVELIPEAQRPSIHLNTTSLDVVTNGVNKEKSLRYLKEEYAIQTKNVLSFGDDHRDKYLANESSLLFLIGPTLKSSEITSMNVKRFNTIEQALGSDIVQGFVSPAKAIRQGDNEFLLRIPILPERQRIPA